MNSIMGIHSLLVRGVPCRNEKIDWWENVYGFNMRCIRELAITEPLVDNVNQDQICTESSRLLTIDIMTVNKSDLAFSVRLPGLLSDCNGLCKIIEWY